MEKYEYFWDSRIKLNDFHIGANGVGRVVSWEIHRIAKMGGITIANVEVTPAGISLEANKNPANMVDRAIKWLQYIRPEYRVGHPLIAA